MQILIIFNYLNQFFPLIKCVIITKSYANSFNPNPLVMSRDGTIASSIVDIHRKL
jgi:hypothetical protein